MARPIVSHFSRPRPLGSSRHRLKVRRDEKLSCSSSGLSVDIMPSAVSGSVDDVRGGRRPESSVPSPDSSDRSDQKLKSPSSSVFVLPSAGKKLGHMLSLINQDDVEFKQNPLFTEIHFFSSDGESSVMHPLRARRLRGLMALAHHLDEEDRFLEVPLAANELHSS